jgi:hypothetical protein
MPPKKRTAEAAEGEAVPKATKKVASAATEEVAASDDGVRVQVFIRNND